MENRIESVHQLVGIHLAGAVSISVENLRQIVLDVGLLQIEDTKYTGWGGVRNPASLNFVA